MHLNIGVGRCSVLGADRDVARIFFSIEAKKISARSRSPREARRAESGGGVLEEGAASPSPPAREFGERCKLPQRGPGRIPGRQTVFTRFKCSEWPLQAV